jgi:hypothetical protein
MSEMRECEIVPCECLNWCRNGMPPITEHHPRCKLYNLEKESVVLVTDLIKGIEAWASDEDGVHPELWPAYLQALYFIGDSKALANAINKSEEP